MAFTSVSRRMFSSQARKFFVGGNWKCNGSVSQANALVDSLNTATIPSNVEVVVAPPALHVACVASRLRKDVGVSGQDVWHHGAGAYTGEVSAELLKDAGAGYSIVGHSERREKGESNEEVARKAAYALSKGLSVIACIGETKTQRDANQTLQVVTDQLAAYAAHVKDWSKVVVAYEPVWAIGTGLTASPAQAQDVHAGIRNWLKTNVSAAVANSTRIIYGGSV
ncbi:hypothetical protein AaE_001419, partial [Aphanomyces astaci]